MFSDRLPATLAPNAISRAVDELRARGTSFLDLTETNPTLVGLPYPDNILTPLADASAIVYRPEPLGVRLAREAVADHCSRIGVRPDPDSIVLTASTSEAYAVLFKLLCNPGDVVATPRPSYPLFDSLTALEGVAQVPYWLQQHGHWFIDRESLEAALTPCTRAVLVVSPNNPTGSMLRAADCDWLANLCGERGLAIISDEVFADFPIKPGADAVSLAGEDRALTFVLGGLSKSCGLPQLKLGWIVVSGPRTLTASALARLEVICDSYLSVSTPVQLAAPALLQAGATVRAAIQSRINHNLAVLEQLIGPESAVSLLVPEGGWSAVLRVPSTDSEEALVLRLIRETQVVVHPGYFYDFSSEAFLVVSLLPDPASFEAGVKRVLAAVEVGRPQ